MKFIITIIKLVLILIIIMFAALNLQNVEVKYFFGEKSSLQMPLFIVIILSFILGMIALWLLSLKQNLKKFLETQKLKNEVNQLKNELNNLKSAPLNRDKKG